MAHTKIGSNTNSDYRALLLRDGFLPLRLGFNHREWVKFVVWNVADGKGFTVSTSA